MRIYRKRVGNRQVLNLIYHVLMYDCNNGEIPEVVVYKLATLSFATRDFNSLIYVSVTTYYCSTYPVHGVNI